MLSQSCRQIALLMSCSLMSACTVFPGLNVSEKDVARQHQYRIEKASDEPGYKVVQDSSGNPLEVVDITPDVIASERTIWLQEDQGFQSKLASVGPGLVPPEYRLGPGDVVSVTVWDHPELNNPIGLTQDPSSLGRLIASDGTIFFPFVGQLHVEGMTTAEVRQAITQGIAKVIAKPQVDVRVIGFRAKRIQVFGEVKAPGVVTLDDTSKGIIEAISERGGLTDVASRRHVFLSRGGQTYEIDLAGLLSGDRPAFNPGLKPGDILQVPDKSGDQVFVLGEVERQAPVVIEQQRMTLTEALTRSGGLDRLTSDDSGVLVFRRPSSAGVPPRVFKLDMSTPAGLLLAGEFELRPRDVVYVKKTGFAKYNSLIAQIAPTITAIYQLTYVDYLGRSHP